MNYKMTYFSYEIKAFNLNIFMKILCSNLQKRLILAFKIEYF